MMSAEQPPGTLRRFRDAPPARFRRGVRHRDMKKIIIITIAILALGAIGLWLVMMQYSPYAAELISVAPASSDHPLDRYVNSKTMVLHVFSTQEVVACILPKASFGYDVTCIVRRPGGTVYPSTMEFQFRYPRNGAIEAISRVMDVDEVPVGTKNIIEELANKTNGH
jgi:hypothetical protein